MRVSSAVAKSLFRRAAFTLVGDSQENSALYCDLTQKLGTCLGIKSSLNSGIRCLPVVGVENPFLLGMQSSELSAILRSTVSRSEDGLELQITNPLNRLKLQLEVRCSRCSIWTIYRVSSLSWRQYCLRENLGLDYLSQFPTV